MARHSIATQTPPATPGAGFVDVYPDSVTKQLAVKNADGRVWTMGGAIRNWNIADVVATGVDTYLTGSALAIPPHLLQAGATFKWRMVVTKSAAGVAAPTWNIRVGVAGTVADTSRVLFTGPSQTALTDTAMIEIVAILRNTGAAGVLAAGLAMQHHLAATGFANQGDVVLQTTSAGFDTTTASLIVGVSVNPGASGVWTHQCVAAELVNM